MERFFPKVNRFHPWIYLGGSVASARSPPSPADSDALEVTMERGEEVVDVHDDMQFMWCLVLRSISGPSAVGFSVETGFVRRKEYYRKMGRRGRGGTCCTGQRGWGSRPWWPWRTSYDLDCRRCGANSELRSLMVGMANQPILVVEGIDCSMEMKHNRGVRKESKSNPPPKSTQMRKQVSPFYLLLEKMLNFIKNIN
ncbi:mitochondrial chaperone BCS1-B [Canna indica]|uniref:Mitochondrial chaperone BCS1-B n=1 Tax=Canna indica TaxID=4628 RepID=A0AAQ3QAT8_9LILI|nr:mitochondrial chaperone BCS1-B [Canna indica]